jgi:hypothetical protein
MDPSQSLWEGVQVARARMQSLLSWLPHGQRHAEELKLELYERRQSMGQ